MSKSEESASGTVAATKAERATASPADVAAGDDEAAGRSGRDSDGDDDGAAQSGRDSGDLLVAMSPRQIIGGFAVLAGLILMLRRRRRDKG